MNPLEQMDRQPEIDRQARERAKLREAMFRRAVQEALGLPSVRQIVFEFLTTAQVDVSPMHDTAEKTAWAIGWQDAGNWWINQIRTHCPEREGQMRAEANTRAREDAPPDTEETSE